MTFCPQPKPRPRLLDKRQTAKERDAIDRAERAKCRKRSGGRCEVVVIGLHQIRYACFNHATENHHLRGGLGVRNRGDSILAEHRIDVCQRCHEEITGHVLRPIGRGRYDAVSVVYERTR